MAAPAVIADMEWEESLLPPVPVPADLEAYVRRQFGVVPGWLARVAPAPWLARAWAALVRSPVAHLPPGIGDLAALVVSQDNSCRYCFGAQRAVLRMLGYREACRARLERDFPVAELSDAERAALDFARRMSRADPRPARAERERLAQVGFTAPAVAELAFVAAAIVFANRAATLLALPPDPLEQMVDRPLVRLLRPVIARRMRSKPRRPEPLPEPNEGPFASVVAALEGSPAAGVLRRAIDGALASPVLPRRTKMLLFAVVARALGCTRTESEMRAAHAADGRRPRAPARDGTPGAGGAAAGLRALRAGGGRRARDRRGGLGALREEGDHRAVRGPPGVHRARRGARTRGPRHDPQRLFRTHEPGHRRAPRVRVEVPRRRHPCALRRARRESLADERRHPRDARDAPDARGLQRDARRRRAARARDGCRRPPRTGRRRAERQRGTHGVRRDRPHGERCLPRRAPDADP